MGHPGLAPKHFRGFLRSLRIFRGGPARGFARQHSRPEHMAFLHPWYRRPREVPTQTHLEAIFGCHGDGEVFRESTLADPLSMLPGHIETPPIAFRGLKSSLLLVEQLLI